MFRTKPAPCWSAWDPEFPMEMRHVKTAADPIDPTICAFHNMCFHNRSNRSSRSHNRSQENSLCFPLFIPFFSTSTLSTFQTWNAGGSWWLKIITDFLRFWDLHKKLGECYQADLQLASDAWSKTSGQQILWWTGNAEVFVNPRKRCGKVKSTPKLSIN